MLFGPPQPDLMPGARNAVGTCLAVQSGEQVALIADEASAAVAASLGSALDERGARMVFSLPAVAPGCSSAADQ